MFEPSALYFDARVWVNLHSSNVEWSHGVGHSATIRGELFPSARGRWKILLSLLVDLLHKLDYGFCEN